MTIPPLQDPQNYGWNSPGQECEFQVPADLVDHYREFRPGYFGYVCPCCKCVWAPGWGETIPAEFRGHIRSYFEGKGCFFNPKVVAGGGGRR